MNFGEVISCRVRGARHLFRNQHIMECGILLLLETAQVILQLCKLANQPSVGDSAVHIVNNDHERTRFICLPTLC